MSARQILVVDDEADIRSLLKEILADEGYEVSVAADASEARAFRAAQDPDLVLLDIWMPDTDGISLLKEWSSDGAVGFPVVMMSGHGTVDTAVEATKLGAIDFVEKPLSLSKLLRTVERALSARQAAPVRRRSAVSVVPVGRSPAMIALKDRSREIAARDVPALITGEAGTGRELFARYMHETGPRCDEQFVELVGGTVTSENAAEALYGSEHGGGISPGVLERASGGILFINGLEDLVPEAQRLLLGALEQGAFRRAGGHSDIPFNAIVYAAARPGITEQKSGAVRRDLLTQLGVVELQVPALREYSEDVPDLIKRFVDVQVEREGLPFRRFSVAAQNRLRNYPWPDNVTGLQNIVRRLLMRGGEETVSLEEVEDELPQTPGFGSSLIDEDLLALPMREAREHFEKAYLTVQLKLCGGKVGKLAERVGMERTHLYRKLKALGIELGGD